MEPIAVVGVGCLLPGNKNPQAFYQSLLAQRCYIPEPALPSLTVDDFPGMQVPPLYTQLDASFLQTLYIAHQALLENGFHNRPEVLQRTGFILGTRETCNPKILELFSPAYLHEMETGIQQLLNDARFKFDYAWQSSTNSVLNAFHFSLPAILAAQTLGLGGPVFALDAACASALYSIKLAAAYLESGSVDVMLAGGFMSGLTSEVLQHYFASLGVAAENGASWPLDRNSGGMAANDGGGVVALKRLADAERDGDPIQLVINGIGWRNQCGKGKLILAPSKEGQLCTYHDTYAALSDISPAEIDFIECHATGTPVGDTIELNSLDSFFERHDAQPLFGSVKGNIGHLLSGSGIAALIKLVYSLREGVIPGTVNIGTPLSSRRKRFGASNLVTENRAWPTAAAGKRPRRGAISCFGFGGSHAHMVVSEYRADLARLKPSKACDLAPRPASLAVVGMGVKLGSVTGVEGLFSALEKSVPAATAVGTRFRGIEQNAAVLQHFLPADSFSPGVRCDHFEFDFLKSGVNIESKGEALHKELMLLNAVDQALIQAGIARGEGRRVGVVVAARQNLCQVQMHLEYYMPTLLEQALNNSGITLDEADQQALLMLARDAVMNHSNTGFDFVATGIGPVIASRIAAVWGFHGPALKLCSLENSLLSALDAAEKMLHSDSLEAVVVAAVDNDPALENRILLKKYAAELGLTLTDKLIDDCATAFVVSLPEQAHAKAQPVLALLDDLRCGLRAGDVLADRSAEPISYFGSRFHGSVTAFVSQQLGFSLSSSASLALLHAVAVVNGKLTATSAQAMQLFGTGFDGQPTSVRVCAVQPTVNETVSAQNKATEKTKERGLVKTVINELVGIKDVLLAPEAKARFAHLRESFSEPEYIPSQPDHAAATVHSGANGGAYFARLFQQNCHLQYAYYHNQRLLSALLADRLADANPSVVAAAGTHSAPDSDIELRN